MQKKEFCTATRRHFAWFIVAVFNVCPSVADEALAAVRADEARRIDVFSRAARSVVCIFGEPAAESGGSGVIVDETGHGLTNFHVVADFLETRRGFGGLSDGRLYPLRVLGIDPGGDIAMFKLDGRDRFDAAPLADSDQLRVGQWVAAMGNPFLLAEDYSPTITLGIISGLHRYQAGEGNLLEYADCIQVSTSINPGNSGGPLFDLDGRLIGINGRASFEERGRVNVGLGYAVTINQVRRFIPGLEAGRLCEHGALGATTRLAGNDLIIDAIQAVSPAERAGIHLGDALLEVAGHRVRTPNEFNNAIAILPAGWPVPFVVQRNGQRLDLVARLERLPARLNAAFIPELDVNHAAVRRRFARFAGSAPPIARLRGAGNIRFAQGDSIDIEIEFSKTESSPANGAPLGFELHVAINGDSTTISEWPPRDAQATAAWNDPVIWSQFIAFAGPLLEFPPLSPDWSLLGADEVAGRIASVIEYRAAGRSLRWFFDEQSHQLLQAAVQSADNDSADLWTTHDVNPIHGRAFPRRWEYRNAAVHAMIVIESVDAGPETSP